MVGLNSAMDENKKQIMEYMQKLKASKSLLTNRDIAKGTKINKPDVDKAVVELLKESKLEYQSFGGITYVRIKEA
jgi:Mn-dependent DtxR family transcriptional regulator